MGVIRNQLMCGVGFSSKLNVTEINEFLLFGIAQAIMKICLQCASFSSFVSQFPLSSLQCLQSCLLLTPAFFPHLSHHLHKKWVLAFILSQGTFFMRLAELSQFTSIFETRLQRVASLEKHSCWHHNFPELKGGNSENLCRLEKQLYFHDSEDSWSQEIPWI